jgi:hypothetical protein
MNKIHHHTHLFGPTSLYCIYTAFDELIVDKFENYQKKSWRNRYQILSSNGIQTLSIPLQKGKNAQQLITNVKISYNENWIKNHLLTLKSAYGNSPYYEFYYPDIEKVFCKKYTYLFDLNTDIMLRMFSTLGLTTTITFSDSYINNLHQIPSDEVRYIKYPQVWEEKHNFTPNMSILDLIFCTGPEAHGILKSMKISKILNP